MRSRDDANAEVELFITNGNLDAAVLRSPALGDVHLGKDFYAGNDGAKEAAWRAVTGLSGWAMVQQLATVDIPSSLRDALVEVAAAGEVW